MIALLLAAVLVGPPSPTITIVTEHTLEESIDKAVGCATEMTLWGSGDLYSTAWALHKNPFAYELNPGGFSVEARIATKMATTSLLAAGCYMLERKHKHKEAKFLRWTVRVIGTAVIANNIRVGLRK